MKLILLTSLILSVCHISKANEALVIGGFGATTYLQVVTKDGVCRGEESSPVIPPNPIGRFGWTSQYLDGKIYLCGGSEFDIFNDCYYLTIGSQTWVKLPIGMKYKRRYAESLVFQNEMYIMGGYNTNQGWLNKVEKLNSNGEITEMDWTLPREIYDFCAVKTDDDKIMVIGGNEYPEKEARIFDSTTVDIFDPVTKMWSNGPAMSKRRATHDCIVTEYNGERGVMVSGGCNENCRYHLKDVSFFSFATQTWNDNLPPMNTGRMGHKMIMIDGLPHVIGGFDDDLVESIEYFDGVEWKERPFNLVYPTYVYGSPDSVPDVITC